MPVTVKFDPNVTQPQAAIIQDATMFNDGVMTKAQAAKLIGMTDPIPTVTGFSPGVGPVGTTVVVTGTNFLVNISNVSIGATPCDFTILDNQNLALVVPAGASSGLIQVTNGGGTAASLNNFIVPPTDAYGVVIIADQPTLWWRNNNGPYSSGTALVNSGFGVASGNFNGTSTNRVPGIVHGDVNVPEGTGVSTWLSGLTSYPGATGVSLEFWLKPVDGASGSNMDIGSGSAFGSGMNCNIAIQTGVAKPFTAQLINSGVGAGTQITTPGNLNFGTIYHVVFTYDHASGDGRIYLNGVLVTGPTPMTPPAPGFYTGNQNLGFGAIGAWMGQLQEIAVYNYALSATQVAAHHAAGV